MNRSRYVLLALLAAAFLVIVACKDDDPPAITPTPVQQTFAPIGTVDPNGGPTARPTRTARVEPGALPQPCSLIAPGTVSAFIGNITGTQPKVGECDYTADVGTLVVKVEAAADEAAATARLATIAGDDPESVTLGDEAFYSSDSEIAARKGNYIVVLTTTKADAKAALLTLAQEAVGNLPATATQ